MARCVCCNEETGRNHEPIHHECMVELTALLVEAGETIYDLKVQIAKLTLENIRLATEKHSENLQKVTFH